MTSRTRWIVLLVSTPLVAFVVIGGLLGRAFAKEGTYPHLRIFEDVVSLIAGNYVEEVDVDKVMSGAMRGLAEGLDADSAYLTPDQAKIVEAEAPVAGAMPSGVGTTGSRADARLLPARHLGPRRDRRRRRPASRPATTSARSTASRRAACRRSRACGCCAARSVRRSR